MVDRLKVEPPAEVTDEDIRDDILDTLDRHTLIDTSRVNVPVSNGIVTLTGSADNYHDFRTVEQIAQFTNGVIDVRNELVIT